MKKSIYSRMHASEKNKLILCEWCIPIKDVFEMFCKFGLAKVSYGCWSNDKIKFYYMPLDENSYIKKFELCCVKDYTFMNKVTDHKLGYKGFKSFGEYITDLFIRKYCELNPDDYGGDRCKSINYIQSRDEKEWGKIFLQEFETAIKETNDKVDVKNKKRVIKEKIQKIENELDFAILDYVDEHKKDGIALIENTVHSSDVVWEYTIQKILDGYCNFHGPVLKLRKTIHGRYWIKYKKTETWCQDLTEWKKFKSGLNKDEMMDFIENYFKPWLDIPSNIQIAYSTEYFL